MFRVDYTDLIGSVTLLVLGAATAVYTVLNYELGTLASMGPGMVPLMLGVLLMVLGALLLMPALLAPGGWPEVDFRAAFVVLLSTSLFAATVTQVGLVPAIVLMTFISVQADRKLKLLGSLILSAALALLAYLIFNVGLSIPLPVFRWPF